MPARGEQVVCLQDSGGWVYAIQKGGGAGSAQPAGRVEDAMPDEVVLGSSVEGNRIAVLRVSAEFFKGQPGGTAAQVMGAAMRAMGWVETGVLTAEAIAYFKGAVVENPAPPVENPPAPVENVVESQDEPVDEDEEELGTEEPDRPLDAAEVAVDEGHPAYAAWKEAYELSQQKGLAQVRKLALPMKVSVLEADTRAIRERIRLRGEAQ